MKSIEAGGPGNVVTRVQPQNGGKLHLAGKQLVSKAPRLV